MNLKLWKRKVVEGLRPPEGSTFTVGMAVGSSLCMVVSLATSTFFDEPLPLSMFAWAGFNLLLGMAGAFVMKSRDPESMLHLAVFFTVGFSNLLLICALPALRS